MGVTNDLKHTIMDEVATGQLAGSATAAQMPAIESKMVNIKSQVANAANIYIGASGVTVVSADTTNTTTGLVLDAGQETGWIPVDNLDTFYYICDNASDELTYMVIR